MFRYSLVIAGLFFGVLFTYLFIANFKVKDALQFFSNFEIYYCLVAMVSVLVGHLFKAIRWWLMLRSVGSSVRLPECVRVFLVSFGLNNVLPLRAGDVYRAFFCKKLIKIDSWKVLGTLAVERILDLVGLLTIFFISLNFLAVNSNREYLINSLGTVLILGVFLVFAGLILPGSFLKIIEANFLNVRFGGGRIFEAVRQRFTLTLKAMITCREKLPLYLLLTALGWFFEAAVFFIVLTGLNTKNIFSEGTVFGGSIIGFSVGSLSGLFPSSPGYVGTYDYFSALGMKAGGIRAEAAAAATIITHFSIWLPFVVIALFSITLQTGREIWVHVIRRKKKVGFN